MQWQEACANSNLNKATRKNEWYVYIMDGDGKAVFVNRQSNQIYEKNQQNINGYIDWEPYNGERNI